MGTAAAVVSGGILLSRVLGLVRESLLASLIGVNTEGDLYRHAFAIPDFLSYLLAGAYLTITLIPILSRYLESDDPDGANHAFATVFRFVALGIAGLKLALWILAPQLIEIVFTARPELHDPLVSLTRIALPAQIFLVSGSVLMAGQYAHKRFVIPAVAPVIYNLGIIGGGLIGLAMGDPSPETFLWGAVAGSAVGNFGLQYLGARRAGMRLTLSSGRESAVREYLMLAIPLMIGQSVAVLDEQFINWFGQIQDGAASSLFFARRLNMVPIGVIAQAAGVAAYPFLARLAASGRSAELNETTERAARHTLFVAAAATAALVGLARPMGELIYGYGEFGSGDAAVVSNLLVIYAFSIPAWGLHQLIARHFYAERKMWVPVGVGTAVTVIAVPTWLLLHDAMGLNGFALASTLTMSLYAVALVVMWGRSTEWAGVRRLLPAFMRGLIGAGLAGLAGRPVVDAISTSLGEGVGPTIVVGLVGLVTTLAVFALVAWGLRAPELELIRERLRNRPALP